jgi:hypothetical protein
MIWKKIFLFEEHSIYPHSGCLREILLLFPLFRIRVPHQVVQADEVEVDDEVVDHEVDVLLLFVKSKIFNVKKE